MEQTIRKRNNSIDIFRFFCALLIVAIHVHPLIQFGSRANAVSVDYFTRIGVPFFFVTAGYFYTKKLLAGKKPLKGYILGIIPVYTFWSAVYSVILIIREIKNNFSAADTAMKIVKGYLYKGVFEHLWFIPSLIIAISVLTLFYRLKATKLLYIISLLLFTVACLGFTYREALGNSIPVLSALYKNAALFTQFHRLCVFGISFVTLGCFICKNEAVLTKGGNLAYVTLCGILYISFIAEKAAADRFNWGSNHLYSFALYPLMLVLFILLIKNPMFGLEKGAKYLRNASSFIYYSHPLFIVIYSLFIPRNKYSILIYITVSFTAMIISFAVTKLNNKKLNFLNS